MKHGGPEAAEDWQQKDFTQSATVSYMIGSPVEGSDIIATNINGESVYAVSRL